MLGIKDGLRILLKLISVPDWRRCIRGVEFVDPELDAIAKEKKAYKTDTVSSATTCCLPSFRRSRTGYVIRLGHVPTHMDNHEIGTYIPAVHTRLLPCILLGTGFDKCVAHLNVRNLADSGEWSLPGIWTYLHHGNFRRLNMSELVKCADGSFQKVVVV